MNWAGIRAYIATLLVQPSAYQGLAVMAAAVGIYIKPEHVTQIAAVGAFVYGLIQAGKRS